jgi:hypothetical protein
MSARVMLAVAFLTGCGGLSRDDEHSLRHATILNGMAYAREDASTPSAALERGAFCSTAAVMRRNKLTVPDAGIECDMVPP